MFLNVILPSYHEILQKSILSQNAFRLVLSNNFLISTVKSKKTHMKII